MVEYLLAVYDRQAAADPEKFSIELKKNWLNAKDSDGFTCLHYSVFKANYRNARRLEEHGADIYQVNTLGLCVMHIAAQGDSPLLMVRVRVTKYYYISKGFKISVEDSKGSTPLHWACYSGKENSVNALLAWGAEMNVQDKIYGLTPLHLAVLSGNGKNVRKLLIRGADRNIRVLYSKKHRIFEVRCLSILPNKTNTQASAK